MTHSTQLYKKAGGLLLCLLTLLITTEISRAQSPQQSADEATLLSDLDIPLMQGFQEQDTSRVVFDTPEGRIIEVIAKGAQDPGAVYDYYQLVLPSLSWQIDSATPKNRSLLKECRKTAAFCIIALLDRERLMIRISQEKSGSGQTVIAFFLDPQ